MENVRIVDMNDLLQMLQDDLQEISENEQKNHISEFIFNTFSELKLSDARQKLDMFPLTTQMELALFTKVFVSAEKKYTTEQRNKADAAYLLDAIKNISASKIKTEFSTVGLDVLNIMVNVINKYPIELRTNNHHILAAYVTERTKSLNGA